MYWAYSSFFSRSPRRTLPVATVWSMSKMAVLTPSWRRRWLPLPEELAVRLLMSSPSQSGGALVVAAMEVLSAAEVEMCRPKRRWAAMVWRFERWRAEWPREKSGLTFIQSPEPYWQAQMKRVASRLR